MRPSGHAANASWFRFKTRLRVDDWSDDPAWNARVPTRRRWLSTNHLMGKGYWVWFIPLGSGSTSVGIVADSALHPFNRINRFERALDWLREFEPQAADVVEAHAGELEDFLALQHFAHGCARVFSPDRWALTGEAGVFTDPFYSPGSDFIAMGNDCIADLIAREVRGEDVSARAESFNQTYLRLFDAFIRLYEGQYPIMGNAQVMIGESHLGQRRATGGLPRCSFFSAAIGGLNSSRRSSRSCGGFSSCTRACSPSFAHGMSPTSAVMRMRGGTCSIWISCGT